MKVFNLSDFKTINTDLDKQEVYEDKMLSQGKNSAYIVHELANLSAILQGRFETLKMKSSDEQFQKMGNTIGRMTDFLMVLRKINSRNIEIGEVSLEEELKTFLDFYRKELHNNEITILEEIDDKLPLVSGERSMLFMILQTVCNNSIRAMNSQDHAKVLTISTMVTGDYVDVVLKDNGGGMTSDQAEKVATCQNFTGNEGTGQGIQMIKKWSEYMGIECKLRNIPTVGLHWLFRFESTVVKKTA